MFLIYTGEGEYRLFFLEFNFVHKPTFTRTAWMGGNDQTPAALFPERGQAERVLEQIEKNCPGQYPNLKIHDIGLKP